jgi:hypothetical protein
MALAAALFSIVLGAVVWCPHRNLFSNSRQVIAGRMPSDILAESQKDMGILGGGGLSMLSLGTVLKGNV